MEKIIQSLIDNWIRGVDTYTHNDSTWLIFTDKKQWVIELTDSKTLWYNYNFFKQIFEFTSLNVVDNQQYITKWVEDNIMNKGGLIRSYDYWIGNPLGVDDVLENGVKKIRKAHMKTDWSVNDTIENGVKETQFNSYENESWVKGVIKGGVKETKSDDFNVSQFLCEEVIDKGVKETNHVDVMKFFDNKMEDTLENGVRLTEYQIGDTFDGIDDIIENGVKHTFNTEYMPKSMVVDIIENGVKSSIPRQYVGEDIIDKVIDKGVIETHDDIYHHRGRVDGVIKNGIKETEPQDDWVNTVRIVTEVIDEGEKINGTFVGGTRQKKNVESVIGYGTKNPTD
jgi:hypothetical protein